jgi:anti-anti-sigma regulatory factor
VEGLRRSRDLDKTFKLVAPSTAVMKVLELAKLDSVFEVSSSP